MTVYLQTDLRTPRPLILIIPGGGYNFCSEREAEPVALAFLAKGYHAAVLRYHVGEFRDFQAALNDGQLALQQIKQIASNAAIEVDKIVVVGFSAGGHLAAAMSTMLSEKPSLCVLGYPAILDSFAEVMQVQAPSLDQQVTAMTPPTFLFTTFQDNVVPVENSWLYLRALEEHDVLFEAHVFQEGKHGLSLGTSAVGKNDPRFAQWFDLCCEWMEINWQKTSKPAEYPDVLTMPVGELMRNAANKKILLEYFPVWQDRSRYKIVRKFNLTELHEVAPQIFNATILQQLQSKLTMGEGAN